MTGYIGIPKAKRISNARTYLRRSSSSRIHPSSAFFCLYVCLSVCHPSADRRWPDLSLSRRCNTFDRGCRECDRCPSGVGMRAGPDGTGGMTRRWPRDLGIPFSIPRKTPRTYTHFSPVFQIFHVYFQENSTKYPPIDTRFRGRIN